METENNPTPETEEVTKSEEQIKLEEKQAKATIFLDEYRELSKKHGFALKAISQWTVVEVNEDGTDKQ